MKFQIKEGIIEVSDYNKKDKKVIENIWKIVLDLPLEALPLHMESGQPIEDFVRYRLSNPDITEIKMIPHVPLGIKIRTGNSVGAYKW